MFEVPFSFKGGGGGGRGGIRGPEGGSPVTIDSTTGVTVKSFTLPDFETKAVKVNAFPAA
jgi:hypothetical protein